MNAGRLGVVLGVAVAALALFGCGGTGSGPDTGGSGTLSVLEKWQRFEDGAPTLRMTRAQVAEAWRSAARQATHSVALGPESISAGSDPVSGDQAEPVPNVVPAEVFPCGPGTCNVGPHPDGTDPTVAVAPVLEHNDVPVAVAEGAYRLTEVLEAAALEDATPIEDGSPDEDRTPIEPATPIEYVVDFRRYGGWLDHTVFHVSFQRWCTVREAGCAGTSPVHERGTVFGVMAGGYSETTPAGAGSATWTGVVVGMESGERGRATAAAVRSGQPDVFLGDAHITIDDLAAPDVDVSLVNLYNVTEGARHGDITWEDLRVENGLFGEGTSEGYITGMFTGPRHQEVGGHFLRDGIAGAFGAKRQ